MCGREEGELFRFGFLPALSELVNSEALAAVKLKRKLERNKGEYYFCPGFRECLTGEILTMQFAKSLVHSFSENNEGSDLGFSKALNVFLAVFLLTGLLTRESLVALTKSPSMNF